MAVRANRDSHLALVLTDVESEEPALVGTYLEDWLAGKQSLRPSTHLSYETHVRRYLTPYLGQLRLDGLRPIHVERMYRELGPAGGRGGSSLSVATLRRIHATLMSAMNVAVKRGLIERNPAATVELPRAPKTRAGTWSASELALFLNAIQEDRLHPLYVLLGLVGLRRGEAVALRWSDVDLDRRVIRIEQSAVRVAGRAVVGPPKSSSGARTVAIDVQTARLLREHRSRQHLEMNSTSDRGSVGELMFMTVDGQPLDPAYVSRHFDRLIGRHGLSRIRLHDLRHTSASLGLASGESLVEVSRRLGHSSITVTADIYSHISPLLARESADRLARHIFDA